MADTQQPTRNQQAVLWLLGHLEEMAEYGRIDHDLPRMKLTPKGTHDYDELIASGFKPTFSEIVIALTTIAEIHRKVE